MGSQKRIFEQYLVTSARLGDQKALAQLYALRNPRLLAHAYRLLGHPEQAADVVQEAWVDILKGLRSLQDPQAFPAWSMRIVTRKAAKFIRSQQQQRVMANEMQATAPQAVAGQGEAAADAAAVRQAIAALPADQAATIALFYLEDMSVAEASVALDIPVGTVKTRLMHAREKLKNTLKGNQHG